jgi:hypothetical protein
MKSAGARQAAAISTTAQPMPAAAAQTEKLTLEQRAEIARKAAAKR